VYRTISVQLPTYNRKNTLQKCLQALFQQTYPNEFIEIIVVDDGSTDGTEQYLNEISRGSPIAIKYIKQNNQGHARARNTGILAAERDIILMLDDDVLAVPDLIREHMLWHNRYPEEKTAILGYITWSPEVKVTDFMWWCENGGPLTRYHIIADKMDVDFRFFYSGNLSIKRTLLQANLFDPEFYFGFDDLELGYRLSRQGLKILYNKQAVGYHYSRFDQEKLVKRLAVIAKGAIILHRKWPELADRVGKPRPLILLKFAKIISFLIYPLAKIFQWEKVIYHYRYQNCLSTAYAKAYFEAKQIPV
jgi:glycosyltransferase involved in cell wall biosynthesis